MSEEKKMNRRVFYSKYERVVEIPEKVVEGVLYRETEFDVLIALCPCGCGEEMRLPLCGESRERGSAGMPAWNYVEHKEGNGGDLSLTLSPSISRTGETCRAHFFIERNFVRWC